MVIKLREFYSKVYRTWNEWESLLRRGRETAFYDLPIEQLDRQKCRAVKSVLGIAPEDRGCNIRGH